MKKRKGLHLKPVLAILADIKNFVRWNRRNEPNLAGFNVLVSKHPGKSYVLAKNNDSFMSKHVLPIDMDYADPLQRPLIANAISEALYDKAMTAEQMENEMVCKSEEIH